MVTEAEIEAGKSPRGGFTRAQLAKWGVPWPPPKGWRRKLVEESTPRGSANSKARRLNRWWDYGFTGVHVARTIGELAGLPLGTRIATNTNKVLFLDEAQGRRHWIEEGTLEPFFEARAVWLPAVILPPVREGDG